MTEPAPPVCAPAERLARALLSRIAEPGNGELVAAVARENAVDVVARLRAGRLTIRSAGDLSVRLGSARPEADLELADRLGARFVCPGDDEWPEQVGDLERLTRAGFAPPLGLWVKGDHDLRVACRRAIAVVGSRAATGYGQYVASELGTGLAARGWTTVSGAAFGIDGAAHRGALAGDGITIAVLACGVDVAYPSGHAALIEKIADDGLVISEWPPGCSPMRHRFLVRNRLIAALSTGTVVVEAAVRSGALNTANHAFGLGRYVMAVPGPVTSSLSAGCHGLMRDRSATCVTCAADVIDLAGSLGVDAAEPLPMPVDVRDDLDDVGRRVLDAVPVRRGAGPARIAMVAGVDHIAVSRSLGALAALGLVERSDAGWRLTALARGRKTQPPTRRTQGA